VNRQEYYAMITHLDAQIKRILQKLNETGLDENTYIFYTADHGLSVGNHGLLGKQNMYDHSVRVPLLVCGPGIAANQKINNPVYLQDIMPSTLELAGAAKPDHVEFNSLMPLIGGQTDSSYDAIYGGYIDLQRMVCDGRYKLIYYPKIDKTRLYDLEQDPLEMNDLAAKPEYQNKIAELKMKLKQLQQQTGDTLQI